MFDEENLLFESLSASSPIDDLRRARSIALRPPDAEVGALLGYTKSGKRTIQPVHVNERSAAAEIAVAVEAINRHLVHLGRADITTRREIGLIVQQLKASPGKYGHRVVEVMANEVGEDKKRLYEMAKVAEVFDSGLWNDVVSMQVNKGNRESSLPWSLIVIAAFKFQDGSVALSRLKSAAHHGWTINRAKKEWGVTSDKPRTSNNFRAYFAYLKRSVQNREALSLVDREWLADELRMLASHVQSHVTAARHEDGCAQSGSVSLGPAAHRSAVESNN